MLNILNAVKEALRITHDELDNDIEQTIAAAKQELVRIGVDKTRVYQIATTGTLGDREITIAPSDIDPLVLEAIKTYVRAHYTDDEKKRVMWEESFNTYADELRKTEYFRNPDEDDLAPPTEYIEISGR